MNSSLSSGCKTNLSSSTRQVAHECFYFTSHSIDYCCFLANLTTHSFAYFTSIWWLLLISCPGISSNTEKCLSRFNIRISFCLHLDFGSDTNFSFATSSAVEKLFLPAWTKHIYIHPVLCSQPALSLSFFFVYPTMPPAASSFTAASITMAALYITCDRPTAVELPWNLNTFPTTSSFSGWLP